MKRIGLVSIIAVALSVPAFSTAASSLKSDKSKLSYSMGYTTGSALKKHDIELDQSAYTQGLRAGLTGTNPAMTEKQMTASIQSFQAEQIKKMRAKMEASADKNLKAGNDFLAANKKKSGVVVLSSGLQYKVVTPGRGTSPTLQDQVTVNYEGRLLNGTVFDSSYKSNKPVTFPVRGVIKGWQEALTHMKPGATWQVFIPADLAYGKMGVPGGQIGPNSTLIFRINLVSVKPVSKNSSGKSVG